MLFMVFPGQGSQFLGMGEFFYKEFPQARVVFEESSDALGLDIKKLCFSSSEEELLKTENTQPALLTTSVATANSLKGIFDLPLKALAGHSVGEYAALVVAGSLPLGDAVRAVRLRGKAMQEAVPLGQGGMIASLGLDRAQAEYLCRWVESESKETPLSPANFNAPGQIVLSGSLKSIQWLKQNFKPEILPGSPKRAKLIPLNVSAPFHCSLMARAQDLMAEHLKGISFKEAQIPIVQNVSAQFVKQADRLKENLIAQVSAPVLWEQSMEQLKRENLSLGLEAGPGKVLQGLFKKMDAEFFKIHSPQNLEDLKVLEAVLKRRV